MLSFAAGNVVQMQASLHQERLQEQEQAALCAKLSTDKHQMQHRCHDLEAKLKVQTHDLRLHASIVHCRYTDASNVHSGDRNASS